SLTDRPMAGNVAVFGEIGLAGEVRPAPRGQERLREIGKLGFEKAVIPKSNLPKSKIPGLELFAVDRVDQAVQLLRNLLERAGRRPRRSSPRPRASAGSPDRCNRRPGTLGKDQS